MILAVDVETDGLPLWKEPSHHPAQPHLVQVALLLVDPETREEKDSYSAIIWPEGWTIPPDVEAIHGITTERALAEGVPERVAIEMFKGFDAAANQHLGYSAAFDRRMLRIAMYRTGMKRDEIEAHERSPIVDVMHKCTPLCRLPPSDKMMAVGRRTFKTPSLVEAAAALLGEKLDGAHDAMTDIRATVRLYWHLQDLAKGSTK